MDDTRCVEIVPISVGVGVGAGAAGAAGGVSGGGVRGGGVRGGSERSRRPVAHGKTIASVATSSAHEQKQCGRSCLENFEVEPRSTWCQSRRREKTLEDCLHTTVHSYDRTTIVIQ